MDAAADQRALPAHRVLSRGDITFLDPDNHHVLAFVRQLDGEHPFLVVANLSARAQSVELDLRPWAGIDADGGVRAHPVPPVTDRPYNLTLGPYGVLLVRARSRATASTPSPPNGYPPSSSRVAGARSRADRPTCTRRCPSWIRGGAGSRASHGRSSRARIGRVDRPRPACRVDRTPDADLTFVRVDYVRRRARHVPGAADGRGRRAGERDLDVPSGVGRRRARRRPPDRWSARGRRARRRAVGARPRAGDGRPPHRLRTARRRAVRRAADRAAQAGPMCGSCPPSSRTRRSPSATR